MSIDQKVLKIVSEIDKYSKFFSDASVMAEVILNSEILEVKRVQWSNLFEYLFQHSKNEMAKGNFVYGEINLGAFGLMKVIVIDDRIISLQLGSNFGNNVINMIKSFKQDFVEVALNTVKISGLTKKLQMVLEDIAKLNVNEVVLQPAGEITTKPIPIKEAARMEPVSPEGAQKGASVQVLKVEQAYDKIYNLTYSIANKYKINIASATITIEDNKCNVQIFIAPPKSFTAYYSMIISRSLDKFHNELEKELKNLNYVPKIEMKLPEEQEREKKGTGSRLPSGEPHI